MHFSTWLTIWPVVAFFLGGLATILTGQLNYRRERAQQRAVDRAAKEQRREEFELQHLMEFSELLRATVTALYDFSETVRRYNEWRQRGGTAHSDEIDVKGAADDFEQAHDDLLGQVGFILIDEIRVKARLAADALESAYDVVLAAPRDEEPPALPIRTPTDECYKAISERVREIYAGPTPVTRRRSLRIPGRRQETRA